jgi:glycogen operon protein
MPDDVWNAEWVRCLSLVLNGKTLQITDENGKAIMDESFLIIVNAAADGVNVKLPPPINGTPWRQVMDTQNIDDPFKQVLTQDEITVGGRSFMLFCDGEAGKQQK